VSHGRHRSAGPGEARPGVATAQEAYDGSELLLALAVQAVGERREEGEILAQTLEFARALTGAEHAMISLTDIGGEVIRVETSGLLPAGDAASAGTAVAVPLVGPERTYGALHLSGRRRAIATPEVAPVTVLARAAAAALAGVEADRRERRDAVGEAIAADRARIARDLHDLLAQRLYATGLQLQALRPGLVGEEARIRLEAVLNSLELALGDVRAAVDELRQPPGSLADRVRSLTDEYAGPLGFRLQVRITGPVGRVSATTADHLLLSLREALSNLARHAEARHGWVEVDVSGAWLMLRVGDDGRGLPHELRPGLGLANLSSRARQLGGVFRLAHGASSGTWVTWMVPL